MLIKFFRNGKGAGVGPVGYLVADKVLAYDGKRDLIRDADGQPITVTREPLPEVLRGNPDRTEALIDASRHQWTYRAGVISFAATDVPTKDLLDELLSGVERPKDLLGDKGLMKELKVRLMERMLGAELTEHPLPGRALRSNGPRGWAMNPMASLPISKPTGATGRRARC